MPAIQIDSITKVFHPNITALDNVSLDVEKGEFLVILGPSGSGKTTLLRIIAGLEKPSRGRVVIDGETVVDAEKGIYVPPQKRDIGMVFQNWALYPNMKVFDNIAFPLEIKGERKDVIRKRVREIAEVLGIEDLLDRYPRHLSGGQQQRVALARALAKNPRILLLDEPFSNLDARVRITARTFVKKLQKRLGITTILVTHDQADAFAVGDRIVVLNRGRIQQIGVPQELYDEPANLFTASFIGEPPINLIEVDNLDKKLKDNIYKVSNLSYVKVLGVRPDEAIVSKREMEAVLNLNGIVELVEILGSRSYVHVDIGGQLIVALKAPGEEVSPGEKVVVNVLKAHLFDEEGSRISTLRV
ncbi:MAG: ABC transporter ATP-binding protein [Desulfurococcales archaeon]|nr:ABC transporter ATP-binding protein [Desulfurococcales archaeon]